MESDHRAHPPVRAGDFDGLGRIYSDMGGLITESDEKILMATTGWDAEVCSPWRRFLPKIIFDRRQSWIDLHLIGTDGKQYAVTLWKTDGPDQDTRTLIESQFRS